MNASFTKHDVESLGYYRECGSKESSENLVPEGLVSTFWRPEK